jgi:hypothetical protein
MPNVSKWKQSAQGAAAVKSAKYREINKWKDRLASLRDNESKLKNPQGRVRSAEENKQILLAVMGVLERRLSEPGAEHMTWTSIEQEVSNLLKCRPEHVFELRTHFQKHKELPEVTVTGRGGASENFDCDKSATITSNLLLKLAQVVDNTHSKGVSVTNKKVRAFFKGKCNVTTSRSSVQRAMWLLGLNWRPTKPRARTLGAFRLEAIRNYLIKLDAYIREIESSSNPRNCVFVFTDESYIHNTHGSKHSYFSTTIDR